MKTSVRILLLVLAALMAISCFVACDSSDKNEETQQKQENTTSGGVTEEETLDPDIHPTIEKTDYADDL